MQRFISFTSAIGGMAKDIIRVKTDVMAEYGLKGSSVNCFFYLSHSEGGMTLTELAKASGEDKAATSRVVKELISDGYVNERENNSKYRAMLTLTDKGVEIAKHVDAEIEKVFKACGLEEGMRDDFYTLVNQIAESLHAYRK